MTSLRHRRPVAPHHENLTWRTDPVKWADLLQVTESLKAPALGYLIGGDLWLDQYAVRKDHRAWWDYHLQSEYGLREDADPLTFLITTGGTLQIITPDLRDVSEADLSQVETLAKTLGIPGDTLLQWAVDYEAASHQRLPLRDFYI